MTVLRTSQYFTQLSDKQVPLINLLIQYQKALCGVTGYIAKRASLSMVLQSNGFSQMTAEQLEQYNRRDELVFLNESSSIRNIIYGHLNSYFEGMKSDPVFYGVNAAVLVYHDIYRHIKDEITLDPIVTERIDNYMASTEAEATDFLESIREIYKDYPSIYNSEEFCNPRFLLSCSDYRAYYTLIYNGMGMDDDKMNSTWKNTESLLKDCKKLVQRVYKPIIEDLATLFRGTRYSFGTTSFKKHYPLAEKSLRQILGTKNIKQIGAL